MEQQLRPVLAGLLAYRGVPLEESIKVEEIAELFGQTEHLREWFQQLFPDVIIEQGRLHGYVLEDDCPSQYCDESVGGEIAEEPVCIACKCKDNLIEMLLKMAQTGICPFCPGSPLLTPEHAKAEEHLDFLTGARNACALPRQSLEDE